MTQGFELTITGDGEVRDKDGNLVEFDNHQELDKHIVDTYEQEKDR
jgi:hypothetical protein